MKSLIRWSATIGLVAGAVLGSLLANSARVLALTAEQVTARLRTVPVFTLTDSQGAPLVATPSEGENRNPVAGVFISRQDALNFLNNLKQKQPQVAQGVQVVPVSLAQIYQMAEQNKQQQNHLTFAFVPVAQEVQQAKTLLQQSGQSVEQFQGVPLFLARTKAASGNNTEGAYLTVKQGDHQVIPVFFSREELQAMLDRLKQVQPDLASTVNVQVVNLEGLIQTLQTSNNQDLNQIVLVPPRESIEFVQSLQQGQGQQGRQTPQAQPTQPQSQNQARPAQPQSTQSQPHQ